MQFWSLVVAICAALPVVEVQTRNASSGVAISLAPEGLKIATSRRLAEGQTETGDRLRGGAPGDMVPQILLAGMKSGLTADVPAAATGIRQATVSSASNTPAAGQAEYVTQSIRGRVEWMSVALKRRLGVTVVPEAKERLLTLETTDGQLLPILEDARGRSFRIDKRLREMDVELLVRRYKQSPMLQVIRIYEFEKDKKVIVDYWCDVCAIVMFELGPCDCCQDTNRLRKRPSDEHGTP